MTIVNAAVTAVLGTLQAAPAIAPQVARVRLRPVSAGTATAVVVRPVASEVLEAEMTSGYAGVVYECFSNAPPSPKAPPDRTNVWRATSLPVGIISWTATSAYTLGQQVIRTTTHRIYECVQAHSGRTSLPEQDLDFWIDVGPTNRWAAFDQAGLTRTTGASPMTMTLQAGIVDAIAFMGLEGASTVTVTQKDGATTLFTQTVDVADGVELADWWDYFFADIEPRQDVVIEGFQPIAGTLEVSISGGADVGVSTICVGNAYSLGMTLQGAQVGITDYSLKSFDEFGAVNLVERNYAKRMDLHLWLPNGQVDLVAQRLSRVRAQPVVWFDSTSYQSLVVFGFVRDWGVNIAYGTHSDVSLSIEGLT